MLLTLLSESMYGLNQQLFTSFHYQCGFFMMKMNRKMENINSLGSCMQASIYMCVVGINGFYEVVVKLMEIVTTLGHSLAILSSNVLTENPIFILHCFGKLTPCWSAQLLLSDNVCPLQPTVDHFNFLLIQGFMLFLYFVNC